MLKTVSLLLILVLPSVVYADTCPKELIKQGTPAPCTGYILTAEVMGEATKLPEKISLLEDKLKLKDMELIFKDEKIKLLSDTNDKKDITIANMEKIIVDNNKNNDLKIGLAVGGTALGIAALAIALGFAFGHAGKISITTTPQ
jgi:hypothetical protein